MERRVRLRSAKDVRQVYEEGRTWAHPMLVLTARPNGLGSSRVGVVAGRRIGSAVFRNRAKRLMREAARRLYPQMAVGWDIVLTARPAILDAQEPQVEEALALLLQQARLGRSSDTNRRPMGVARSEKL